MKAAFGSAALVFIEAVQHTLLYQALPTCAVALALHPYCLRTQMSATAYSSHQRLQSHFPKSLTYRPAYLVLALLSLSPCPTS
jgi:hypothetical protein